MAKARLSDYSAAASVVGFGASRHSNVTTLPFSTVNASRPCLSSSAFAPNNSRRHPLSAATLARSSDAMVSRSSTVAIILAATPLRSDTWRNNTLEQFDRGASRWSRGVRVRSWVGSWDPRSKPRSTPGGEQIDAGARTLHATRHRAQMRERLRGARRGEGYLHQHVVLQHARARHITGLRLSLAPGGDFHEHGEIVQRLCARDRAIFPRRCRDAVRRSRATARSSFRRRANSCPTRRFKPFRQRPIDIAQMRHVGQRVGYLGVGQRPARPVGEPR